MDLIKCLLLMVSSFMLYAHIEMMGSVSALSRVISVALDRMEALKMPRFWTSAGKISCRSPSTSAWRMWCFPTTGRASSKGSIL